MNPKPLSLTSRLIVPFIGAAIAGSQRKRVDTRSRWEGKTFLEAPRLPEDRSALGITRLAQIAREHRAYARSSGIANGPAWLPQQRLPVEDRAQRARVPRRIRREQEALPVRGYVIVGQPAADFEQQVRHTGVGRAAGG